MAGTAYFLCSGSALVRLGGDGVACGDAFGDALPPSAERPLNEPEPVRVGSRTIACGDEAADDAIDIGDSVDDGP